MLHLYIKIKTAEYKRKTLNFILYTISLLKKNIYIIKIELLLSEKKKLNNITKFEVKTFPLNYFIYIKIKY